jgi:guanylate kinase
MIVTLTGPSCAGKTTLESMLRAKGFVNVVSTTTRPKRTHEVNGMAYHFVTREKFLAELHDCKYVESTEFNGNLYAVSKDELHRVMATGKSVVLIVEPNGLAQIRDYAARERLNLTSYFIDNPLEVIMGRFQARFAQDVRGANEAEVQKVTELYASRLITMIQKESEWCELEHLYDHYIDGFDETNSSEVVRGIINEATEEVAA